MRKSMTQVFYNQLRNSRIKNVGLGVILLLMAALLLYIISMRASNGKPTNAFYSLLFTAIIIGFVFLLARIPFGQVIESTDKRKFSTFYKLGGLKLKLEIWDEVDKISLEQDVNRYYCVTIKTTSGKTLVLEKWPTANYANTRLNELKELFGHN